MKKLGAVFLLCLSAYAAGSVTQSGYGLPAANPTVWVTVFRWTGDASTGSVPNTNAQLGTCPNACQGWFIVQAETVPGTPSPTSGYSVALNDAAGVDALGGAAASLSASTAQSFAASTAAPPVQGTLTLAITGQNVASAQGVVYVFLQKPGTVNVATLGRGAIASSANWLTLANSPLFDARRYNFSAQSPGGTLTGSTPATITFSPVPAGLNGTDSNHWLYISGCSGGNQPVVITGGTARAGGTSGTIAFTPANSCGAGWTIGPAAGGVIEAIQAAATAGGGVVLLPADTTISLYAHPVVPSNVTIQGSGWSSVLQIATNQWPASPTAPAWVGFSGATQIALGITSALNATGVQYRDFTMDMNGANQTNATFGSSVAFDACSDCLIDHVQVINAWHHGQMIGDHEASGGNNRIINNYLRGPNRTVGNCAGGVFVQAPKTLVLGNYGDGMCDENFVSNGPGAIDDQWIGNTAISGIAAVTAFHTENSSHQYLTGNVCRGGFTSCYNVNPTGVGGAASTDVSLVQNFSGPDGATYPTLALQCQQDGSGHTVTRVTLTGNTVNAAGNNGVSIGAGCTNVTAHGNNINGGGTGGTGLYTDATNTGIDLSGNVVTGFSTNVGYSNGTPSATITSHVSPNVTDDNSTLIDYGQPEGANVASATTIVFTGQTFHVTGTTTIQNINAPTGVSILRSICIHLIPDFLWSTNALGNIALGSTAVVGKTLTECYSPSTSKWYPSY